MQPQREVVNVRDWVEIRAVARLSARLSPQGHQSPGVFFGTMCKGEDKVLEEGQMIPNCSMCSNSCLAAWRQSGARCLK